MGINRTEIMIVYVIDEFGAKKISSFDYQEIITWKSRVF